jgi:hypothetical protein
MIYLEHVANALTTSKSHLPTSVSFTCTEFAISDFILVQSPQ